MTLPIVRAKVPDDSPKHKKVSKKGASSKKAKIPHGAVALTGKQPIRKFINGTLAAYSFLSVANEALDLLASLDHEEQEYQQKNQSTKKKIPYRTSENAYDTLWALTDTLKKDMAHHSGEMQVAAKDRAREVITLCEEKLQLIEEQEK